MKLIILLANIDDYKRIRVWFLANKIMDIWPTIHIGLANIITLKFIRLIALLSTFI